MKKITSIILALTITLLLFSSCTESEKESQNSDGTGNSAGTASDGGWDLKFETGTLNGDSVSSEDFSDNKLTVLNVWATWCSPCVKELPYLNAVNQAYKDKGVEIVGMMQDGVTQNYEKDKSKIEAGKSMLSNAGATYKVILPNKVLYDKFLSTMQYFPTTFFLDSDGNIVETVVGSKSEKEWGEIVEKVLKKIK